MSKWADALAKAVAETGGKVTAPSPDYPVLPREPLWREAYEAGAPSPENLAWLKQYGYKEVTHHHDGRKTIALSGVDPDVFPNPMIEGYKVFWWLREKDRSQYVRLTRYLCDHILWPGSTLTVWWKKTAR